MEQSRMERLDSEPGNGIRWHKEKKGILPGHSGMMPPYYRLTRRRLVNGAYRSIPKVDAVLNEQALMELPYAPEIVKRVLRETLDAIREDISQGRIAKSPDASQVAGYIAGRIRAVM